MRSRGSLLAFILVASLFVLPAFAQAAIPFFGPIIPPQAITGIQGSEVCPAGWGMVMRVINNLISFSITLVIVFVAPIMIAYAGFLFVVNPVNASGKEKAKSILWNVVIGLAVALAGWMIVDAVMVVLYNPNAKSENDATKLDTWWKLITSGDLSKTTCLPLKNSLNQATLQNTAGLSTGVLNSVPRADLSGSACDPAAVQAAAASAGKEYELTNVQANTLACIARPESSCGRKFFNYRWGSGSSAAGAFQVLLQSNAVCYENPACLSAVGVLRGPLNCAAGFSKGNPTNTPSPLVQGKTIAEVCVLAAANLNCSAATASCLLKRNNGSFSPWQADINNVVQTGCINRGVSGI